MLLFVYNCIAVEEPSIRMERVRIILNSITPTDCGACPNVGERWLFVSFILVELLIITTSTFY